MATARARTSMPGAFYLPASRSIGLTEELVWFGQTKPGRVLRDMAQPEGVPRSEDDRYPIAGLCDLGQLGEDFGVAQIPSGVQVRAGLFLLVSEGEQARAFKLRPGIDILEDTRTIREPRISRHEPTPPGLKLRYT